MNAQNRPLINVNCSGYSAKCTATNGRITNDVDVYSRIIIKMIGSKMRVFTKLRVIAILIPLLWNVLTNVRKGNKSCRSDYFYWLD